jgi:GntR family transcriptional repressor for pyruvate dehydrogenase complex
MSLTDAAIDRLQAMVLSGDLKPGQRLPREADLAKTLGLSRNSLREAVRALSLVRILDVRQGDGTYVSDLSMESLVTALTFVVEFHQDSSVLELLEMRRILEPAASELAVARISQPALQELEEILRRVTSDSSVEELVAVDIEFHRAIGVASGNAMLASLIESLSGPTQRARLWRGLTEKDALERTLAEHEAIFDAIAARDAEMARALATVHVAGVVNWLRRALD